VAEDAWWSPIFKEEMRRINEYMNNVGVELVPNMEMHMDNRLEVTVVTNRQFLTAKALLTHAWQIANKGPATDYSLYVLLDEALKALGIDPEEFESENDERY
jgi:hypothetical protein